MNNPFTKFEMMRTIAQTDVDCLEKAEKSYGESWKNRGGVGAFMMLARKWDRLRTKLKSLITIYLKHTNKTIGQKVLSTTYKICVDI